MSLLLWLGLLLTLLMVASLVAVRAWRLERHKAEVLARRLEVEGRIEALTVQTLQAMQQAAREYLAQREGRR